MISRLKNSIRQFISILFLIRFLIIEIISSKMTDLSTLWTLFHSIIPFQPLLWNLSRQLQRFRATLTCNSSDASYIFWVSMKKRRYQSRRNSYLSSSTNDLWMQVFILSKNSMKNSTYYDDYLYVVATIPMLRI